MKREIGIRRVVNSDSDIAIEVKNLHKSFKLPTEKAWGLKQAFFNRLKGTKGYKVQSVLKGLNFQIKKGEFVGIVGRNGSGKSTLLKILSGIYYPEKGEVTINGSLVPFIELGVGFNPELTGRENVYLNGALLGFSNKEMDEMYNEIWEFAELEQFQDQKLKNYSSGMQVRLAFSIAIRAKGDILILDEVLAVGDEAFQNKCNQFFSKIKRDKAKTVVLVTHSMESVRKYCNHAILIRDGKIKIDGSPEDIANSYSLENTQRYSSKNERDSNKPISVAINDLAVQLISSDQITQNSPVKLKVSYDVKENIDTYIALTMWDVLRGQAVINSNSKKNLCKGKGKKTGIFEVDISELNDTNIRVYISIRDKDGNILAYNTDKDSPTFLLRRDDYKTNEKKPVDAVLFKRGVFKLNEE